MEAFPLKGKIKHYGNQIAKCANGTYAQHHQIGDAVGWGK
jgi:hypothetical protein